ncbi:MAG: PilZ domain-containing protein [Pirellulales bacterium]|nr:PilZ domain-containing protein [Pirellulales bacterium]
MLEHDIKENPLPDGLADDLRCDIMLPSFMADFFESEASNPIIPNDKRRFKRWHFNSIAALQCRQSLHALHRELIWHRVYTKDISRGGLAFLHSEQLFPLEQMRVLLPTRTVEPIFEDCKECFMEVTRCRRWGEMCYEIAARFIDSFRDL